MTIGLDRNHDSEKAKVDSATRHRTVIQSKRDKVPTHQLSMFQEIQIAPGRPDFQYCEESIREFATAPWVAKSAILDEER
jgi:hypothetical protein